MGKPRLGIEERGDMGRKFKAGTSMRLDAQGCGFKSRPIHRSKHGARVDQSSGGTLGPPCIPRSGFGVVVQLADTAEQADGPRPPPDEVVLVRVQPTPRRRRHGR